MCPKSGNNILIVLNSFIAHYFEKAIFPLKIKNNQLIPLITVTIEYL